MSVLYLIGKLGFFVLLCTKTNSGAGCTNSSGTFEKANPSLLTITNRATGKTAEAQLGKKLLFGCPDRSYSTIFFCAQFSKRVSIFSKIIEQFPLSYFVLRKDARPDEHVRSTADGP